MVWVTVGRELLDRLKSGFAGVNYMSVGRSDWEVFGRWHDRVVSVVSTLGAADDHCDRDLADMVEVESTERRVSGMLEWFG